MRIHPSVRSLFLAVAVLAIPLATGCAKKADAQPPAEQGAEPQQGDQQGEGAPDAVTENNDNGSVTWTVGADGKVTGVAKTSDGKPITKKVDGVITWKTPEVDLVMPVSVDEKDGTLVSFVPPPEDDLTQMDYTLYVDSKPWTGVIYVPKGGTKALVDDSRASAENAPPENKRVGPHGGTVTVVGKDRVELVADKDTGQTRVYILDADYNPVPVGERRVKMAVVGESAEMVELDPEPGGLYFYAGFRTRVDPVRVTLSVGIGVETHACIVGWRPGVRLWAPGVTIAAYAAVPRVRIMTEARWGAFTYVGVRASARASWGVRAGVGVGVRGGVGGGRVVVREREHHDNGLHRGHFEHGGHGDRGEHRGHGDNGLHRGGGVGAPSHGSPGGGSRGGGSRGGGGKRGRH